MKKMIYSIQKITNGNMRINFVANKCNLVISDLNSIAVWFKVKDTVETFLCEYI